MSSASSDFAASLAEFNTQKAGLHQEVWPCTFTISTDPATPKVEVEGYAGPASRERVMDELHGGYIEQTVRSIGLLPSQLPTGATLVLGTRFTIVADTRASANVGTIWQARRLDDPEPGGQLRAICWRVDD